MPRQQPTAPAPPRPVSSRRRHGLPDESAACRSASNQNSVRGGRRHGLPDGDGPVAGVLHVCAAQRDAPAARVDPLQPRDGDAAAQLLYDVELAVLPRLKLQVDMRFSER